VWRSLTTLTVSRIIEAVLSCPIRTGDDEHQESARMPDCNYGVLLYCTTETHVIRFPVSPKQGKQHTEAEARPICTSTYSFRVARKCIQSAVTGTRNSRIGLININSLSVSDFDFFFRGHGRRVAIHDRLAAVIEALWSPLTGNCCAMLGLWMVMGKCGAGGSEPPNDQRGAHAVAVEHADGECVSMTTWESLVALT